MLVVQEGSTYKMDTKRNKIIRPITILLILSVMISCILGGCAQKNSDSIENKVQETASFLKEHVSSPETASIGGEWTIKGLVVSGIDVEQDYFDMYYDSLRAKVKSTRGVLNDKYNTEYARAVIGVCAIKKDPSNVEGYDLTLPLDDYEKVTEQGLNAVSYILVAARISGTKLENEDKYIDFIIEQLKTDSLDKDEFFSDYISMAILALSFYKDRSEVNAALDEYLDKLSKLQNKDGGFGNCESNAEAIMALSQADINILKDKRFIKNGNRLDEALLKYRLKNGSFCHVLEKKDTDFMATEKGLLALEAIMLAKDGKKLYESR